MVICYSLLTNQRCLLLDAALKTITVSQCFSCDCFAYFLAKLFADGEIEKQIYFSQSTVTGRCFKSFETQPHRSHGISSLLKTERSHERWRMMILTHLLTTSYYFVQSCDFSQWENFLLHGVIFFTYLYTNTHCFTFTFQELHHLDFLQKKKGFVVSLEHSVPRTQTGTVRGEEKLEYKRNKLHLSPPTVSALCHQGKN